MSEPLTWKGQQVPWVTRWTSEVIDPKEIKLALVPDETATYRISLLDETEKDFIDGVLWLPEQDSQGVGEPMWRDVHSHRQRQCQTEGHCQVCGNLIETPALWVIPNHMMAQKLGSKLVTDVTPIGADCLDAALSKCPYLKQMREAMVVYEVRYWRPYALFGDYMDINPATGALRHFQTDVNMTAGSELKRLMARQMVVELWDFRRRRM